MQSFLCVTFIDIEYNTVMSLANSVLKSFPIVWLKSCLIIILWSLLGNSLDAILQCLQMTLCHHCMEMVDRISHGNGRHIHSYSESSPLSEVMSEGRKSSGLFLHSSLELKDYDLGEVI